MTMEFLVKELRKTGDPIDREWAIQIANIRRRRPNGDIPLPKQVVMYPNEFLKLEVKTIADLLRENGKPNSLRIVTALEINKALANVPDETNFWQILQDPDYRSVSSEANNALADWDSIRSRYSGTLTGQINRSFRKSGFLIEGDLNRGGSSNKARFSATLGDTRSLYEKVVPGNYDYFKRQIAFTALSVARNFDAVLNPQQTLKQ